MDPSVKMLTTIMYPVAAFANVMSLTEAEASDYLPTWKDSPVNPQTRIDSLDPNQESTWRMDGAQADGHRLFAIPRSALGKPPRRIDVYLGDQDDYDLSLSIQEVLQFREMMMVKSGNVARLPVAQHILRALEHWSASIPNFEEVYQDMPFGSYIVIEKFHADITRMGIQLVACYDTEQAWLSVKELKDQLQLSDEEMPLTIDVDEMELLSQPHEAISIVTIPRHQEPGKKYVFKSILNNLEYLYHELKQFMAMEPHANIISRPKYLVTKKCRFGGKVGVCGFVLQYYPCGTLRDTLWYGSVAGTLTLQLKCRWAREITSAVLHIQTRASSFYTGLKHTNIVMSAETDGLHAVLLDFEQRTGRYPWTPPEIYYLDYLEVMATATELPGNVSDKYVALVRSYIPEWQPSSATHTVEGRSKWTSSWAWSVLTPEEREHAQVFMLGKLLWYIFEGVGSINNGLNLETFREETCEQVFPEFRQSPKPIRDCIRRCTIGAPEWSGRVSSVVKRGRWLWPRGKTGVNGEPSGTGMETQQVAKEWWVQELKSAEKFLGARRRQRLRRTALDGDASILSCMKGRPQLWEVQRDLDMFESSIQ